MRLVVELLVRENAEKKFMLHKSFIKVLMIKFNFAAFDSVEKKLNAVQNAHDFFNPVEH